jgi:predicted deacylase
VTDKTIIRCDIDFEANGKFSSFLGVPISTNESAYGTITIPITVIRNGEGPTISFTGGVHGDEYEGPVTLMKLARSLQPEDIQGRVIIIPALNLPAVSAGTRCSPIDGLNLNRVFPGLAGGSITEMIAHYISSELVPLSDVHVDMHSGGKSLQYIPSIYSSYSSDKAIQRKSIEGALAFGADVTVGFDDHPDNGRYLTTVFDHANVIHYSTELGGAGMVNPYIVKLAEHGVRNMMKYFGVMTGDTVTTEMQDRSLTRLATVEDVSCYVIAPDDGLYEPFVDLGDKIESGQPLGQVHYPHHNDVSPWLVTSPKSGFLLCKRPTGKVQRGDNIAIIAQDVDRL